MCRTKPTRNEVKTEHFLRALPRGFPAGGNGPRVPRPTRRFALYKACLTPFFRPGMRSVLQQQLCVDGGAFTEEGVRAPRGQPASNCGLNDIFWFGKEKSCFSTPKLKHQFTWLVKASCYFIEITLLKTG